MTILIQSALVSLFANLIWLDIGAGHLHILPPDGWCPSSSSFVLPKLENPFTRIEGYSTCDTNESQPYSNFTVYVLEVGSDSSSDIQTIVNHIHQKRTEDQGSFLRSKEGDHEIIRRSKETTRDGKATYTQYEGVVSKEGFIISKGFMIEGTFSVCNVIIRTHLVTQSKQYLDEIESRFKIVNQRLASQSVCFE